MKIIKKFLNIFSFIFLFIAISSTSICYAGVNASSGSGGGGGGGSWPLTDFAWKIVLDVPSGTVIRSFYGSTFTLPTTGNMAYVIPTNPPIKKSYPNDWTNWKEHPSMAQNNHYGVKHYQNWDLNRNSVGAKRVLLDSPTYKDFQDELFKNSFRDVGFASGRPGTPKQGFAYTNGSQYADLIYLEGNVEKPVHEVDYSSTLVKLWNSGNSNNNFDYTGQSYESIYNMRGNSARYNYESKENEFYFNHQLSALIYTVSKTTEGSIIYDSHGNVVSDNRRTHYDLVDVKKVNNTASWNANVPSLKYSYYLPMNLNTEDYLSTNELSQLGFNYSDISSTKIQGKSENYQKVSDGGPINLVDNNSAKKFSMTLNNDQLGIPRAYQGGIDIQQNKPGKPVVGSNDLWKQLYYEPTLNMSSNSRYYNPNVTSLIANGKEYLGQENLSYGYGYKGEDFKYRSIKAGDYKLGANGKPYWSTKYGTSIYFDYGGSYDGVITSAGSFSPVNGNGTIQTRENKRFVSEIKGEIEQPILCGDFNVKTVGGYKK